MPVVGRGPDGPQEPVDDERGEAERQLVDEQQPRRPGQAAGEGEHLLLAAGEQADAAVEVRLQLREQLDGAVDVAAADPQVLARRSAP